MGTEQDFQWIEDIFDEKKRRQEKEEIDQKERALEAAKYDSLIDEFWSKVKEVISSAVGFYNSHIEKETDRLRIESAGKDSLQIKKITIPLAEAGVVLNRPVRRLLVKYLLPRAVDPYQHYNSEKQFRICVIADRLCLEDASSGKQTEQDLEISAWILADFFKKLHEY